ncbi:oligosaccharide flippase family protein [Olivibacter sp. SDN3]|uniref:lipopolysaccharide biosynthesis protein n=1 Tax=Olivibacter sp. SDN3 TaxID=2764720 RepID=UPI001650F7B5|nr:oligosaccharide flippase family protein [Olivibacter sp. SDN3]QNL50888.1 oligosaccharide flippase family protein [Olivibacter sp. SDN3]
MSTLRKFAGQTIIYGLSTIIARLINFLLTPLFAFKYNPSTYGIFGYMYSWAAMINALLAFGMETTFFRYLQKRADIKEKVYSNTFIIILFTSSLFVLSVMVFSRQITSYLQHEFYDNDLGVYVKYFVFILVADALAVIPFAKIRADGRPARFGMIKLINIITFISFNLLFIVVIPWMIAKQLPLASYFVSWYREGWVGYVFISNLIASLLTLVLLLPELLAIKLAVDKTLIRDMLAYSFPVLIANFSFIINENLDKVLLKALLPQETSARDVGIYTLCSKLAVFMSIFVNAFRLGAEPFFFSQAKEKNAKQTYAIIMDYFVIALALAVVALVANIDIIKHFTRGGDAASRAAYWSGLHIVPVLLTAYMFLGIYMSLSIWYKLSDQTKYGLYISGCGAFVTIVLNFLLIPVYGYTASAWITLATYGSMMVLSYFLGQKKYPIPYHTLKNLTYIVCAVLICWLSFSIFDRNIFIGNALFLFFVVLTYFLERKRLTALLKRR